MSKERCKASIPRHPGHLCSFSLPRQRAEPRGRERREKRSSWLPATETGTGMKGQGRLSVGNRVLQEVLALKESQSGSPWEAGMAVEQAALQRYLGFTALHGCSTRDPSVPLVPHPSFQQQTPDTRQEASSLFTHPVPKGPEVQTAEQISLAEQHGICFPGTSSSQEPACSAQGLAFQC